jgi:3-hydroxyisobutyrate dehydrogenase-like beta-hydroxyacid dehydrogenase
MATPGTIGFIGLGTMGAAMVTRLLATGHSVVVWNRSAGASDALVELGATKAGSVGEVLRTGLVFSILSNDAAVKEVFTADELAAAPEGSLHVNMATVSAATATELDRLHRENGVAYAAAPVLGRSTVAEQGALTVLSAGADADLARAMPYLEAMGRRIWPLGVDPAGANIAKISMNYLIIHALQAMAESITLLDASGVDSNTFVDIMADSLFPGPVYSGYGALIADRRYQPAGFTTRLGLKDLGLAEHAASGAGVSLATAAGLREVFEAAIADGHADDDWSSIAEVTRARSSGA